MSGSISALHIPHVGGLGTYIYPAVPQGVAVHASAMTGEALQREEFPRILDAL